MSVLFRWQEPGAAYLLIGAGLYLVGTILVTIVFNVPRNDALRGGSYSVISKLAVCSRLPIRRVSATREPARIGPSVSTRALTRVSCHSVWRGKSSQVGE